MFHMHHRDVTVIKSPRYVHLGLENAGAYDGQISTTGTLFVAAP